MRQWYLIRCGLTTAVFCQQTGQDAIQVCIQLPAESKNETKKKTLALFCTFKVSLTFQNKQVKLFIALPARIYMIY